MTSNDSRDDSMEKRRGNSRNDGIYNGSTRLLTSLLALINLLLAAGIVGMIAMYGKISAFEVRFQDLEQKVDMVIQGQILVSPQKRQ